jgi:hypothetical protein
METVLLSVVKPNEDCDDDPSNEAGDPTVPD